MNDKDALTGAHKADALMPFLRSEIERSLATGQTLWLMCANIDSMKHFNMHNGHLRGDELLSKFVTLLEAQFEGRFPVFRYGGDSFAVVCHGLTKDQAQRAAGALCASAKSSLAPFQPDRCGDMHCQGPAPISVSIGLASYEKSATAEGLRTKAEQLLDNAKEAGRGQVCMEVSGP